MTTEIINQEEQFFCIVRKDWQNANDFINWYSEHEEFVKQSMLEHGVVVFKGTGLDTREDFADFSRIAIRNPLQYVNGNSPRTKVSDITYTSTEFPAEAFISLHNEMSYSSLFPEKVIFFCLNPPQAGGETPILNGATFFNKLNPELVKDFSEKNIKYIRNLHGGSGIGPSWQDTFETDDRAAVEAFCTANGIGFEWSDDALRLEQLGPSLLRHPVTGKRVWFNQADQFHPSNNPKEIYETMKECYEEDEFPINARFSDNSSISEEALEHIREVSKKEMIAMTWEKGDVMVVDNLGALHGRNPFEGPRTILVSMGHY